jgi:hypothetical protein
LADTLAREVVERAMRPAATPPHRRLRLRETQRLIECRDLLFPTFAW